MKGWKTWLASAGLCGLGVYLIEKGQSEVGMICILNGLSAWLGLAIKLKRRCR